MAIAGFDVGKQGLVYVTGVKELDRNLRKFDAKLQKKYIRQGIDRGANEVLDEFRRLVPVETGAMRDVAKKKPIKRSRKRIGRYIGISRDELMTERETRGGKLVWDRKRSSYFYYPAVVELDPTGKKPLRTALYFKADRVEKIMIARVRAAIKGETWKRYRRPRRARP